jgi:flagellar biosynthesis protein FlhB
LAQSGAEPTEQPTPQRLLKARQRGQVAISRELSSALALVALVGVGAAGAAQAMARLVSLFHATFATPLKSPLALGTVAGRAFDVAIALALAPAVVALLVGVLLAALQTGGLFSWQALAPSAARLSPLGGMGRLFSARTAAEIGKGSLKVTLVGAVALVSLSATIRSLPALVGAAPGALLMVLGAWTQGLALRVALVLLALGLLDWLLARRRHRRGLMMTRDEVKRELKESEGDPQHKVERQRLHRQLGEQRMVEDVRKADFVVVNPDHIAVAVRYDRDADQAPVVLAKGERLLAEQIKQVAREAGVPIYRDVGLARALGNVEEGDEIPEALYQAVAELLRALWEVDQPAPSPAAPASGGESPPSPPVSSTWRRV